MKTPKIFATSKLRNGNRKQFKVGLSSVHMNEELLQRDLINNPEKIGNWNFYNIGATTIKTLKEAGIIRNISYGKDIEKKKVDGLITYGEIVIAVIENKKPKEFRTDKQKNLAINQELEVAKALTKLLIVTDTKETLWINALNGEIIKDENGNDINLVFNSKDDDVVELINKINDSITTENSNLKPIELINPTKLASQIWQDIWMVSGATPENCLYTFVELFIFKYLSDLEVLKGTYSFDELIKMYDRNNDEEVLQQYAKVIRPKIKELFEENPIDHTTIINGTIFVSKDQKAVKGYSTVFKRVLFRFRDYKKLDNIHRDFKSKLFESFMKESISKKNWGQFFTPLKVVKAIVGMTDIKEGDKVCDPACGVGKFLLEPIANNLERFYKIKNGKIEEKIYISGFDKGFDTEEQKTIILAKANMLIYFSDLIKKHPNITNEFSKLFNKSFLLKTNSILGTLAEEVNNEYDWILTNPPYVMTGSSNLKEEIAKSKLESYYKINAMGVEGLFMEWIIRALRPNGKAFIIIPDGILNRLNDKNLRKFIRDECYIDCIISLPTKTFFTTIKKTYILGITKKNKSSDVQKNPVLTYLVSEIGETLDVYRFETPEKNDLNEAVILFNQFKGAKNSFKSNSERCKIQPIDKFNPESNWSIDRWWSKEEKIKLGVVEEENNLNLIDFSSLLGDISNSLKEYQEQIKEITNINPKSDIKKKLKKISLKDAKYFELSIGKRILKKDIRDSKGKIPIFSANVFTPMGYGYKSNIPAFDKNFVLWGIDGDFDFNIKKKGEEFISTDHCGTITIKDDKLLPEFLLYALYKVKDKYGFDRGLRASLGNMQNIEIDIPLDKNEDFDLIKQKEIADKYMFTEEIKSKIKEQSKIITDSNLDLSGQYKHRIVLIPSIFNINLGSAKYDRKYFSIHKGNYPVYSGQTKNNGEIAKIDTYDYEQEGLTWTIDGYAGRVFYRNGKFSMTTHCGLLIIKDEFKDKLDYEFLKSLLDNELPNHSVGEGNKRLKKNHISQVGIKIPINYNGEFDLDKQKEIAGKYKLIGQITKELQKELNKAIETSVELA